MGEAEQPDLDLRELSYLPFTHPDDVDIEARRDAATVVSQPVKRPLLGSGSWAPRIRCWSGPWMSAVSWVRAECSMSAVGPVTMRSSWHDEGSR